MLHPVRAGLLGLSLLAPLVSACGGQSDALSTDTGNPPVIIGQKLRVSAVDAGVVVSGSPGAVTPGASVEVRNVATGQSRATMAAQDGSFEVELEGSVDDEYNVQASLGGQSSSASVNGDGGGEAGLAGLEFLLDSAEGFTPLAGTSIRLSFDDRNFSANAGCNSLGGSYTLCAGKLCATDLFTTDIGCQPDLHAQDEWLADFLTASPGLTHAGDRLTLEGADATLEFVDREVADADRPLTGRTWTVDTLIDGGSASNVPFQTPPTLQFGEDGTLTVSTGCNAGSGTYSEGDGVLTLGTIPYTERGCGSNGSAEQHIIQVLSEGTVSFEIDAARLTIERGALGLSATTE